MKSVCVVREAGQRVISSRLGGSDSLGKDSAGERGLTNGLKIKPHVCGGVNAPFSVCCEAAIEWQLYCQKVLFELDPSMGEE
jgi:hypothetical protein